MGSLLHLCNSIGSAAGPGCNPGGESSGTAGARERGHAICTRGPVSDPLPGRRCGRAELPVGSHLPAIFSAMEVEESWFDPRTGVERVSTQTTFPGGGPSPAQIMVTDASRAFRSSNDHLNILPATSIRTRWLNPWAAVCDWAAASDVRFA